MSKQTTPPLEQRIKDCLGDQMVAAATIVALIRECEVEIGHADHAARQAETELYDPIKASDSPRGPVH